MSDLRITINSGKHKSQKPTLDYYDNMLYDDSDAVAIRRITRAGNHEWIPLPIESALKQQELDESRVRIACEKEKWLTHVKK